MIVWNQYGDFIVLGPDWINIHQILWIRINVDQCGLRIQITGSHNSALNAAYCCSLDSSCPIAFTWLAKVKNTEGNISKTSEKKMSLTNLVLLGLVIMLQQHISSATPRPKVCFLGLKLWWLPINVSIMNTCLHTYYVHEKKGYVIKDFKAFTFFYLSVTQYYF